MRTMAARRWSVEMDKALYGKQDQAKGELSNLSGDRLTFFAWAICILSILAQTSLLLVSWGKLPPEVPLFYSRPWGEQILAVPIFLYLLPAVALFCLLLNFLLANFILRGDFFLRRVLLATAILVAVATLYNTVKIVSLLI